MSETLKPETIARLLSNGGVCVVVGGRASNFSQQVWEYPRFVFWDADKYDGSDTLPSNTRFVIMLRFVSHRLSTGVMDQCRRLHYPMEWMQSGEASRMLKETYSVLRAHLVGANGNSEPKEPTVSTPTTASPPPPRTDIEPLPPNTKGALINFVRRHWDPRTANQDRIARGLEIDRLFKLAQQDGHTKAKRGSIQMAVWTVEHVDHGIPLANGKIAKEATKSKLGRAHVLSNGAGTAQTAPSGAVAPDDMRDFTEAEKMLADALAAVQLTVQFVRKLRGEVTRSRKQARRMKALLEE